MDSGRTILVHFRLANATDSLAPGLSLVIFIHPRNLRRIGLFPRQDPIGSMTPDPVQE